MCTSSRHSATLYLFLYALRRSTYIIKLVGHEPNILIHRIIHLTYRTYKNDFCSSVFRKSYRSWELTPVLLKRSEVSLNHYCQIKREAAHLAPIKENSRLTTERRKHTKINPYNKLACENRVRFGTKDK